MSNTFIRSLYIIGLLLVSFCASVFMVLESGEFYQSFYPSSNFDKMGYVAATISEVFIAIMAGIWLPNSNKNRPSKTHPANYLFKAILLLLFATTVFAASSNVVSPIFKAIQKQRSYTEIENVLLSQVEDHKQSLTTFINQNQPVNSAITTRNQNRTKEKLIKNLNQRVSMFDLYSKAIFLLLLRFGIQLANLCCIWLVGWIYRNPKVPNKNQILTKQKQSPINLEEKSDEKTNLIKLKDRTRPSFRADRSLKNHERQKTALTKNIVPAKIKHLKSHLIGLIDSRHPGVSLSELLAAIGENEGKIQQLISTKCIIDETTLNFLEQVVHKIEQLYQNEMALSI